MINVGTSIPALGMDTEVEENCPKTPPGSAQQQSPGQCLTPPVPPSSPAGCRLLVPPLPAKRSSGLMGSCSAGAQEAGGDMGQGPGRESKRRNEAMEKWAERERG